MKKQKLDLSGVQAAVTIAMAAAEDKKATDVVALEVGPFLGITDYFVLATGSNDRQVAAIAENVEDEVRTQCGLKPLAREGARAADWVLLDFGDFVVHIFLPETRAEYRLERLWNDAALLKAGE